jgi:hypothetical protein
VAHSAFDAPLLGRQPGSSRIPDGCGPVERCVRRWTG